jgi:peptide/nickel transport system substrate-binding protein
VLSRPTSDFLYILTQHQIIPKHLYEGKNFSTIPYNDAPVGTGPFRFESWDHNNNEIRLTANNQYFEGRPFLDTIVIKYYKNNADLWAALMRGEVDFVMFLNQKDYEVLSKDPSFKTYQFPSGLYFAILYNLHDPILNDRQLRHALSYAVDRKALMRAVGIDGVESNGPFYPQSQWVNKEIEPVMYDPLRAIKILNQLGWKDKDGEGIFKKENKPLILTMLVDRNQWDYYQMALVLRQQLSEVGVGLKIIFYDDENQLTKVYLANIKPQMRLRMYLGSNFDPSVLARSWYSSSSEFGRLWTYKNKKIDQLFEEGLSIKDEGQRIKDYQKIYTLIYEDQPACFLFFSVVYHALSSKVANAESLFNDYMPAYLMKQWFITNERG